MPTHHLLKRNQEIPESHKCWLEGLLWGSPVQPPAHSQYLIRQLWLCVAKSCMCPKTNCMLCLFNAGGLILDTLLQLKEWNKKGKPTSWVRCRIGNSYQGNIFKPKLSDSLTENKVYRRCFQATEVAKVVYSLKKNDTQIAHQCASSCEQRAEPLAWQKQQFSRPTK